MRPPIDGTVVLTGASSGIGLEMARLFAQKAKKLILVARRKERLDQLAAELDDRCEVVVRPCDLADLDATAELARELDEQHGPIDVLVNNAGLGMVGLYEQADWKKVVLMNRVNVDALLLLTRELLPGMVERDRGGILFISSGFGLTVMPVMSAYVASKHYVTAFAESLRMELAGTQVVVTQVCPGPVDTEFEDVAGNPFGRQPPSLMKVTPAACAEAAVRGFERGRAMVVPGFVMKILMAASAMTPRFVFRIAYGLLGRQARRLLASDPHEGYQRSS